MLRFVPTFVYSIVILILFELMGFAYFMLSGMGTLGENNVNLLFLGIYFLTAGQLMFSMTVPQLTCTELIAASGRRKILDVSGFVGVSACLATMIFVLTAIFAAVLSKTSYKDIPIFGGIMLLTGMTSAFVLLYTVASTRYFWPASVVFFCVVFLVGKVYMEKRIISMELLKKVPTWVGTIGGFLIMTGSFFVAWGLAYLLRKKPFDKHALGMLLRNKLN